MFKNVRNFFVLFLGLSELVEEYYSHYMPSENITRTILPDSVHGFVSVSAYPRVMLHRTVMF